MDPRNVIWSALTPENIVNAGGDIIVKEPDILTTQNNRIYFYSDIGRENVLKLNTRLAEMGSAYISEQICRGLDQPSPIYLHINSYGGSIFHGLSAMDSVLTSLVPIYSVVDGCCASAATFVSVAANKRLIQANAYMLVHQLSSFVWGKFSEFEDEMKNLELLMDKVKTIYKKFTNVPTDKLDELLKHDLWWDAEQCLDYGLVDEIIRGRRL